MLNVNGYYDALGAFLDVAVEQRFLPAQQREVLIAEGEPKTLLARLAAAKPPSLATWLSKARDVSPSGARDDLRGLPRLDRRASAAARDGDTFGSKGRTLLAAS